MYTFRIVVGQVPNGSISDDLKDQLADAALHTSKAFAAVRKGRDDDPSAIQLRVQFAFLMARSAFKTDTVPGTKSACSHIL